MRKNGQNLNISIHKSQQFTGTESKESILKFEWRVCHMKENTLWNDSSHLRSIKACQDQCTEIPSFIETPFEFKWTPVCLGFEIWG